MFNQPSNTRTSSLICRPMSMKLSCALTSTVRLPRPCVLPTCRCICTRGLVMRVKRHSGGRLRKWTISIRRRSSGVTERCAVLLRLFGRRRRVVPAVGRKRVVTPALGSVDDRFRSEAPCSRRRSGSSHRRRDAILACRRPLRVNSAIWLIGRSLPLYPDKADHFEAKPNFALGPRADMKNWRRGSTTDEMLSFRPAGDQRLDSHR